jgi:hypothetical protein
MLALAGVKVVRDRDGRRPQVVASDIEPSVN